MRFEPLKARFFLRWRAVAMGMALSPGLCDAD